DSEDPDVGVTPGGRVPGLSRPGMAAGLTVGMWLMECLNPSGTLFILPPTHSQGQLKLPYAHLSLPGLPVTWRSPLRPLQCGVLAKYGNPARHLRNN
ncbi:hypothetical protein ABG768_015709, partial [Culter alburnus]